MSCHNCCGHCRHRTFVASRIKRFDNDVVTGVASGRYNEELNYDTYTTPPEHEFRTTLTWYGKIAIQVKQFKKSPGMPDFGPMVVHKWTTINHLNDYS